MKSSALSPSRLSRSPVALILLSLVLMTLCVGCAAQPKAVSLDPPRVPAALVEPCPIPPLSGDIARDLVSTEEARLCAEADKAGITAWSDSLQPPPAPKRPWYRRIF